MINSYVCICRTVCIRSYDRHIHLFSHISSLKYISILHSAWLSPIPLPQNVTKNSNISPTRPQSRASHINSFILNPPRPPNFNSRYHNPRLIMHTRNYLSSPYTTTIAIQPSSLNSLTLHPHKYNPRPWNNMHRHLERHTHQWPRKRSRQSLEFSPSVRHSAVSPSYFVCKYLTKT